MQLPRLLVAAAITGVLVMGQAMDIGPAYANTTDLACKYDYISYNACLDFRVTNDVNWLTAHVGLDSFLPEGYAQEIVAHGAAVRASLWGDDGSRQQFIADLTVTPGWPAAGPDGLGVELSEVVSRGQLNEDIDDEDEVYAVVSYFDFHGDGTRHVFHTGTVHGDFSPLGGGGPGCLVACQ